MADYTATCLESLDPKLKEQIGNVSGMREVWCKTCLRVDCGYSARNANWEDRMKRQKEVLIDHPTFADHTSSRYESFQKTAWPTLFQPTPIVLNEPVSWATVSKGTEADQNHASQAPRVVAAPDAPHDPAAYPDLPNAYNTPFPAEGKMVDGSVATGMRTQVVDPWAAQTKIVPGSVITLTPGATIKLK